MQYVLGSTFVVHHAYIFKDFTHEISHGVGNMFNITESLILHVRSHVQILIIDGELFLLAPKVHNDHHLAQDIARLRLPFKV